MRVVSWFSAGVSSAVATALALKEYPDMDIVYIDIDNHHPDSLRFVDDCEAYFGKKIERLKSPYLSVERVIQQFRYINSPYGARCTEVLKKRVRKEWEREHKPTHYVWGMDSSPREVKRAERIVDTMPEFEHIFPLIDEQIPKGEAHGLIEHWGIKRPVMYDLGYPNNNCIGCVKGKRGYWNKIRVDFPEVFERMAKLEREVGATCINGTYLDELEPETGREPKIIVPDCGIFCYRHDDE